MRKIWIVSVIAGILLSMGSVYGEEDPTSAPVSIGVDEFAPWHFTDQDGHIRGFAIEVVQHVLHNMGMTTSVEMYPWVRVVKMFEEYGELDMLIDVAESEARHKIAWFPAETTAEFSYVVSIHKDNAQTMTYHAFEDLKGKRVGLLRGSIYPEDFLDYVEKFATVEYVPDAAQNFQKLEAKRVDCVIEDLGVSAATIKNLGFQDQLVLLDETPVFTHKAYTIFSKRRFQEETARQFSDALKTFKTTEEYQKIYDKYLTLK